MSTLLAEETLCTLDGAAKLERQLRQARAQTDDLFSIVPPAFIYERPIAERHRLIFYLGHLEAFDWNLLGTVLGSKPVHAAFDKLFEAGIDPDSGHLPADQPSDWPTYDQVTAYQQQVRNRVDQLLAAASESILHMALEHRLMHLETLAYILHNMPYGQKLAKWSDDPVQAIYPLATPPGGSEDLIAIPAGQVTLGKEPRDGFGWDNESGIYSTTISGFHIGRTKVSNRAYLRFVEAGAPLPHFWQRDGDGFSYRGMFARTPLPLDAPVYVTHDEASDYARYVGKKLPTEAQYHRAAFGAPEGLERPYPWGDAEPAKRFGNFDCRSWDPVSVFADPDGDSAWGVRQTVGNGWEWTSSLFRPFPAFSPHPSYPGYSANFFDDEHYVMKGASPRTAAKLIRRSLRNWFRRDYPFVYATFRCVEA